jgi:hypothetical protein
MVMFCHSRSTACTKATSPEWSLGRRHPGPVHPEVNSQSGRRAACADDWTKDNAKTQQYDWYKVRAVLNEIDGYDHFGSTHVGMPALLGMSFPSVSTGQKLPILGAQPGG